MIMHGSKKKALREVWLDQVLKLLCEHSLWWRDRACMVTANERVGDNHRFALGTMNEVVDRPSNTGQKSSCHHLSIGLFSNTGLHLPGHTCVCVISRASSLVA